MRKSYISTNSGTGTYVFIVGLRFFATQKKYNPTYNSYFFNYRDEL
jgi:hypothetical protein